MKRRHLLAVCGASFIGLAGCATDRSDGAGNPGDETPSPDGSGTPTTDGSSAELDVSVERLQPAVVRMDTPDSIATDPGDGKQNLFLRVTVVEGDPPARSELSFRFDGDHHAPLEADTSRYLWRLHNEIETRYNAERGEGWLCFELPATGAPEGAGLTWSDAVWTPSPDIRDRLAAPSPPLSAAWSVPDSVTVGEAPTVEATVTNEGDRTGRFVGALNRSGPRIAYTPVDAVSHRIPPGSTETMTFETSELGEAGGEPLTEPAEATYHLSWPSGQDARTVEVVPAD